MHEPGRGLVIPGGILLALGLLLLVENKAPFLGKLPGDILVKRGNVTSFFPLATGVIFNMPLLFSGAGS